MSEKKQGPDLDLAARIVDFLNELFAIDPEVVKKCICTRFACSRELAEHPTVEVFKPFVDDHGCELNALGILNGLCGLFDDGLGPIEPRVEEKPWGSPAALLGFTVLTPGQRAQSQS